MRARDRRVCRAFPPGSQRTAPPSARLHRSRVAADDDDVPAARSRLHGYGRGISLHPGEAPHGGHDVHDPRGAGPPTSTQHVLVRLQHEPRRPLRREVAAPQPCSRAEPRPKGGIRSEAPERLSKLIDVAGGCQEPVDAARDQLRWTAHRRRDDRNTRRHSLQHDLAERLRRHGAMDEHVELPQFRPNVFPEATELDLVRDAELGRSSTKRVRIRVVPEQVAPDDAAARLRAAKRLRKRLEKHVLPLPGREPPDDADDGRAGGRTFDAWYLGDCVRDDRVVDDPRLPQARQGAHRLLRVRDHRCRQQPGRKAHQRHGRSRQVVGRDPVPHVPHDGDMREPCGRSPVEGGLERVRMHEVGVELTDPATQPQHIRGEADESPEVETQRPDAVAPEVAQAVRHGQNLGLDPEAPEPLDQRSLLAEDHPDVGVGLESREEPQQCDLAAREPRDVAHEDHAKAARLQRAAGAATPRTARQSHVDPSRNRRGRPRGWEASGGSGGCPPTTTRSSRTGSRA